MSAGKTAVWYPTVDKLLLLKVPKRQRPRIRERLRPWLSPLRHAVTGEPIGVVARSCFETAQALVMTARDPGVKYVEGVYIDPWFLQHSEPGDHPDPEAHAWATVDGFYVDLMDELMAKKSGSARGRRYQEHSIYTHQEVEAFLQKYKPVGSHSIVAWPFMNDASCLAAISLARSSTLSAGVPKDSDHQRLLETVFERTKQALINGWDAEVKRKNQRKAPR